MPIYTYKCSSCGASQDVLRRISDPPLTVCPKCGLQTFDKQVTAAGFQLKGSGWYVTDFRNNSTSKVPATPDSGQAQGEKATTPSEKTPAAGATLPNTSTSTTASSQGKTP